MFFLLYLPFVIFVICESNMCFKFLISIPWRKFDLPLTRDSSFWSIGITLWSSKHSVSLSLCANVLRSHVNWVLLLLGATVNFKLLKRNACLAFRQPHVWQVENFKLNIFVLRSVIFVVSWCWLCFFYVLYYLLLTKKNFKNVFLITFINLALLLPIPNETDFLVKNDCWSVVDLFVIMLSAQFL